MYKCLLNSVLPVANVSLESGNIVIRKKYCRNWIAILFTGIWIGFWGIGEYQILKYMFIKADLSLFIVMLLWTFGGVFAVSMLIFQINPIEHISITQNSIIIIWKQGLFRRKTKINLQDIVSLRIISETIQDTGEGYILTEGKTAYALMFNNKKTTLDFIGKVAAPEEIDLLKNAIQRNQIPLQIVEENYTQDNPFPLTEGFFHQLKRTREAMKQRKNNRE